MTDAFPALQDLVRKVDYDRYLAALFARAEARPHLLALYAFNYEVAKTAETVSQPIAGAIRLQWWRDAIAELYAGQLRKHEVVLALAQTVREHDLPRALFDSLIDARDADLEEAPFANFATLETYVDATSGHLMRLAARVLGAGESLDKPAHSAGIAYGLAGLLRAVPHHAARRRLMLPLDALQLAGLSQEEIFFGIADARLAVLIAQVAERALAHHQAVSVPIPRRFLPALLPAAVVRAYLKVLTRPGFNAFRDPADIPLLRRQFAMLRAVLRGRI
jgi:phytoene synthase